MRAGNGPDMKYNIINSNVRKHEINIMSTKPMSIITLNLRILNYFILLYSSFNNIL